MYLKKIFALLNSYYILIFQLCVGCGKEILDFCHDCGFLGDNDDLEPNNEYCFEELLISEVQRRRELWDITCDLKLRGPVAQTKAWTAIAEALSAYTINVMYRCFVMNFSNTFYCRC